MELTDAVKTLLLETARTLRGAERRRFLAQTVQALGSGGQRRAERELGWSRQTIRKGQRELEQGSLGTDAYHLRGRKAAEEQLPRLLDDIRAIVDSQSQTDPQFRTNRLYTRLSAAEVRRQLIAQKGYSDAELPTERTLRTKLNLLGYRPIRVAKAKPKKRLPKRTRSSSALPR